ncbi:MAG: CAF17-like 4Fe-4S cluster assembly/insertion protein YgfZ [Mycobacteriales bacterium]
MRSPLLARAGAVAGVGVDGDVAAHYGDPFREQRMLLDGGALVDRSHRSVVRVSGPDRLSWLHSLTSQYLEELPPNELREALILSPHGHVEHHLTVRDDGAATWLTGEPATSEGLVGYLDSMRFMLQVEVVDLSASHGVLSRVTGDSVSDDIVAIDELLERVAAAEVPLVGHDAWEAHRVARRAPRLGFETDHRTIPHEVGWIGLAVHLDKGCYRGQETVARVHNLGRPPRRLVFGYLDGTSDELPPAHTPVELDGQSVGFLGTAVHHAELGPVALAVVKRTTPDDAPLITAGMAMKTERVVDA